MCGIAGFFHCKNTPLGNNAADCIAAMNRAQRHRGPDSKGTWLDHDAGLALGHQRLAILDLSSAGAQPMLSHNERYVIVYNGEVYNSAALRLDIEKKLGRPVAWRGQSDTEVVLEACALFGVEATLKRCIGMFALALWDRQEQVLTLARDRFGVKPLYWTLAGETLIFASELKSLREHPAFIPKIDRNSVAALVHYCFIPEPVSIYVGVQKLRPGHIMEFRKNAPPTTKCYWDAFTVACAGLADRITDEEDALDRLHALLRDAVSCRMISDVPLGAFLSGGIDSSLVVALMQEASSRPVHTFSIGFHESEYNEAPYAKRVAEHLGTDHTELYVSAKEAMDVIPLLPSMFGEPFADSSQIPTFLVSQLARSRVTVALSGDGGDEIFAGYPRYFDKGIGRGKSYKNICMSHWKEEDNLVPGASLPPHLFHCERVDGAFKDDVELKQFLDTVGYLPGDILVKVDRTSMAVSLEARPPFLDYRVYELAWRIPPAICRKGDIGKWPLRRILGKYIPTELFERPKMGFGVPTDHWLRGPLRDWAEDLLDERQLKEDGIFTAEPIRDAWRRHLAGENWQYWLWDILMFQAWKREQAPALAMND